MRSGWRAALPYYPLLSLGAVVALVWAALAPDSYFQFAQPLAFPVNEIGVALGLAWLAQEILEATGPSGGVAWRDAVWPGVLGLAGAAAAAVTYVVYVRLSDEPVLLRGLPIVCGVDVFFSVALARSIFRRGVAVYVVIIIALVGDVIALLLVSARPFASPAGISSYGLIAAAIGVSLIFRHYSVGTSWAYVLVAGPISWLGFYRAGLHPALALLPIVPFLPRSGRALGDFAVDRSEHAGSAHFESTMAYPLQLVAFLFGLVNAGVVWREFGTGSWAVLTACLAGRPLGILLAAILWRTRSRQHLHWPDLVVIAFIGSVGSVFALFLSTAALPTGPVLAEAKLGAIATLAGVLLAGVAARALRVGRFRGGHA
jgi:NhaA family Na+:H+ antiporter